MKTTKPLLEDKLVTWKRAYEFVWDELRRDFTHGAKSLTTDQSIALSGQLAEMRAAAARTAAILIQGVDLGDNSPT